MGVSLAAMRGADAFDAHGHHLGRLHDLIADLGREADECPVTAVVVTHAIGRHRVLRGVRLEERSTEDGFALVPVTATRADSPLNEDTEVLLVRDVLDSPVVTQSPVRRGRVADVVLRLGRDRTWATAVDVSVGGSLHRLLGRSRRPVPPTRSVVPISRLHLLSRHGHAAHLHDPAAWVFGLDAKDMAAALTRMPVQQAQSVLTAVDEDVADRTVEHLHPHVRARVTGVARRPRLLRFRGWRLHPAASEVRGRGHG